MVALLVDLNRSWRKDSLASPIRKETCKAVCDLVTAGLGILHVNIIREIKVNRTDEVNHECMENILITTTLADSIPLDQSLKTMLAVKSLLDVIIALVKSDAQLSKCRGYQRDTGNWSLEFLTVLVNLGDSEHRCLVARKSGNT